MANSIENKVVSLKFDNDDFMKKLGPTLAGIDALKKSLDFKDAGNNLNQLKAAGKDFNLGGIGEAVDDTSNKFSILAGAASVALGSIAATAISTGAAFVKSFAFGPIFQGFAEFETNANSIQTILANTADKGTTLDDVTKSLDVLNGYADKTIFNFGEMTKGVGLFTANNVDLQTSVDAVKGISNLIAMTGGNTEQAKGAFIQLSQAISRGSVQAQDWMSVMTAGFGGPLQKLLFESAKALGTLPNVPLNQTFDEWTKNGGDFKEAMAEGVFTADALKISLQAMSGDLSEQTLMMKGFSQQQAAYMLNTAKLGVGAATEVKTFTQLISTMKEAVGTGWAESFKIVIGNFEEAKVLLTGVSNAFGGVISELSGNRNADLSFWKIMGGREGLIQSVRNVLWSLFAVVSTFKNAFRDVFPYRVGENLVAITNAVQKFTAALVPSGETLEKFKRIFVGIFSIFSIAKTAFSVVFNIIGNLLNLFGKFSGPGTGGFLGVLASLADGIAKLAVWMKTGGEAINKFVDEHLGGFADKLNDIDFANFINDFKLGLDVIWEFINRFIDFAGVFHTIQDTIQNFWNFINSKIDFSGLFEDALNSLEVFKDKASAFFKGLGGESPGDFIDGFVNGIKQFSKDAFEKIKEFGSKILEILKNVLGIHSPSTEMFDIGKNLILGLIQGIREGIPKIFQGMKDLGIAIVKGIANIDFSKVGEGIKFGLITGFITSVILLVRRISDAFGGLRKAFEGLADLKLPFADNRSGFEHFADAVKSIAKALVILAVGLFIFSKIDPERLGPALSSVAIGLGVLGLALVGLNQAIGGQEDANKITVIAAALLILGGALIAMSAAMKILSTIDSERLGNGILAISGLLVAVGIFVRLLPQDKKKLGADGSIEDAATNFIKIGLALILFAHGLKTMAKIVKVFGEMDPDKMKQGLFGLAVAMGIILVAMNALPNDMGEKAKGLLIIAGAIWILSKAIEILGGLPFETAKQGLASFALIISLLAIALLAIPPTVGEAAAAVLAVAGAMLVFLYVVQKFGEMDFNVLVQGMISIALMLGALVIASNLMRGTSEAAAAIVLIALALIPLAHVIKMLSEIGFGSVILAIIGLALALVVLGAVAWAGIATGATFALMALAVALILFGEAALLFGVGAVAMGFGIGLLVVALSKFIDLGSKAVKFFRDDLPTVMMGIGKGFAAFIQGFVDQVPMLLVSFQLAFLEVLKTAGTLIPAFTGFIGDLIIGILSKIDEKLPEIQEKGLSIFNKLIDGLNQNIDAITGSVVSIFVKFLTAISERLDIITLAGIVFLARFISGIADNIHLMEEPVNKLISEFVKLIGGAWLSLLIAGIGFIADFIDGVLGAIPGFVNKVVGALIDLMNGVADVIRANDEEFGKAMGNIAEAILEGLITGLWNAEAEFSKKLIDFVKTAVVQPFKDALGIKSPSKITAEMGGYLAQGFAVGLNEDTTAEKAAGIFANNIITQMNSSLSQVASMATEMDEFNPTITPVLDLEEVQKGANKLSGLLASPTLDTSFTSDQAASLAAVQKAVEEVSPDSQHGSPSQGPVFNQTIHAPTPLDAEAIYRNTKSQFAFAQEELSV